MLDRFIDILPTITIREGYRVKIYINFVLAKVLLGLLGVIGRITLTGMPALLIRKVHLLREDYRYGRTIGSAPRSHSRCSDFPT